MRILFVSHSGASLGIAQRCTAESHDVKYMSTSKSGLGLVDFFESDKHWLPDIVMYDNSRFTAEADSVRAQGMRVLGPAQWSSMMLSNPSYQKQIINSLGWTTNSLGSGTHLYITGWINGSKYIASYISILYRRFMSGGAGPDLGCTGILAKFDMPSKTFETFLSPLEKVLRKVNYRGAVHIHAVVNGDKFDVHEILPDHSHPLVYLLHENTNLSASDIILRLLDETSQPIKTIDNWASGIKISLPPYPYEAQCTPAELVGMVPAMGKHIWFSEVSRTDGKYIAEGNGLAGWITARGKDEMESVRRMYRTVSNLKVPDLQWRNDIGKNSQTLISNLRQAGWLGT